LKVSRCDAFDIEVFGCISCKFKDLLWQGIREWRRCRRRPCLQREGRLSLGDDECDLQETVCLYCK
jgi:hypothetical protein